MTSSPFEQNQNHLPPKEGEPLLHRAARLGDVEEIERLVKLGHDINAAFDMKLDPGGWDAFATPLMVAAGSGYGASVRTMKHLLDLGADPKPKHPERSLARYAAAGLGWNYVPGGDAPRLRLCLELGCDPNDVDARGVTLLADASGTGDVERVKTLLDFGADPKLIARVFRSNDWIYEGMREKFDSEERFKEFVKSLEPKDPSAPHSFQIPLLHAVKADSLEVVRLLLASGADVSVKDSGGKNAFCYVRSVPVALLLKEAGLNVEEASENGWQPICHAIIDGNFDAVEALLAAGANPNSAHDRGYSVFMTAVGTGERKSEILKLLARSGAEVKHASELGWNAFHAAIDTDVSDLDSFENPESIFQCLIDLGIDINHRNNSGDTPLTHARRCKDSGAERILATLGATE